MSTDQTAPAIESLAGAPSPGLALPEEAAPALDTVERAETDSDRQLPFRALGLTDEEFDRIRVILGRRPTGAELAM